MEPVSIVRGIAQASTVWILQPVEGFVSEPSGARSVVLISSDTGSLKLKFSVTVSHAVFRALPIMLQMETLRSKYLFGSHLIPNRTELSVIFTRDQQAHQVSACLDGNLNAQKSPCVRCLEIIGIWNQLCPQATAAKKEDSSYICPLFILLFIVRHFKQAGL